MICIFTRIKRKFKTIIQNSINKRRFGYWGKKINMDSPLKIKNPQYIFIQDKVTIKYKTWLAADDTISVKKPFLYIGTGSHIGNFNHIYATGRIVIGKNVLIADKVYIADNLHNYEKINIPIMHQPVKQLKEVLIGDGTWIGENVCIIGVKIGKNCVIGANSVVTKDIPDYCVAVGAPAKIIKKFSIDKNKWVNVN